jgi:Na+-translocating ferredoxin:NAD+ oxidoreductase RnfD subunit
MAGRDPVEQLRLGTQAYLDLVLEDPTLQRVALIDAPAVLGWEARHEIAETYVHGMVREVLRAAMEAGLIREQAVEPLAHVLLAGLLEGALYVARGEDAAAARAEVGAAVDGIIAGL